MLIDGSLGYQHLLSIAENYVQILCEGNHLFASYWKVLHYIEAC